jgi:hypothetical protein
MGRGTLGVGDRAFIGAASANHPEFASAGCVHVVTRNGRKLADHNERRYSPEPNSTGCFGYAISHSGSDLIIGAVGEHAPDSVRYSGPIQARSR